MKNYIIIAIALMARCLGFSQQIIDMNSVSNGITPVKVQKGNTAVVKVDSLNTVLYEASVNGRNVVYSTSSSSEINALMGVKATEGKEIVENQANANGQAREMNNVAATSTNSAIASKMSTVVSECSLYIRDLNILSQFILAVKAHSKLLFETSTANLSITTFRKNFSIVYGLTNVTTTSPARTIHQVLTDFNDTYARLETAYEAAHEDAIRNNLPDAKEKIKKAMEKLEEVHDAISEKKPGEIISELDAISAYLRVLDNFSGQSSGVIAEGDLIRFEVNIKPKNGTSSNNWTTAVELPVKGGLKVDFSLGPVLSFGKNAKDEQYFAEKVESSGKFKLGKHDDRKGATPGMAAIVHAYRRSGNNFALGGLFGVGAGFQSINDSDLSLFFGGTAVLGREQKVFLGLGASFLNVNRLKKPEYKEGNEYDAIDLSEVTRKEMKCSFFFSVSYNLTNRVEVN